MIDGVFDRDTAVEVTRRGLVRDTSNQDEPWEPTEQDKAWQVQHFANFPDGGFWSVPGTASTFQVFTSKQLLVFRLGNPDVETNQRIMKTARAIGWTVEVPDRGISQDDRRGSG